jgi:hypothetical protein
MQEFTAGWFMWLISTVHFRLRQLQMCMHGIRPWVLRTVVSFPLQLTSQMLSTTLSNRLLLALEVAIEYWLALMTSIEAMTIQEDLEHAEHHEVQQANVQLELRSEMEYQREAVEQFINERCAVPPPDTPAIHCRARVHCASVPMLHSLAVHLVLNAHCL